MMRPMASQDSLPLLAAPDPSAGISTDQPTTLPVNPPDNPTAAASADKVGSLASTIQAKSDNQAHKDFIKQMDKSRDNYKARKQVAEALAAYREDRGRKVAQVQDTAEVERLKTRYKEEAEEKEREKAKANADRYNTRKVYDPFACPPDLDMAMTHLKASRIALEEAKANSSILRLLDPDGDPTNTPDYDPESNSASRPVGELLPADWERNAEALDFKPDSEVMNVGMPTKADRVPESDLNEYCPCCNNLVKTKVLTFAKGIDGIKSLGVGFSLYFKFNYELMITIFLVSLVAIYMTVRNTLGTMCYLDAKSYPGSSTIAPCIAGWTTKVSISNYGLTKEDSVEKGLYFLIAVIVYVFSIFWDKGLQKQAEGLDEAQDSPDDWTVVIKNIHAAHTQMMYIDKSLNLEIPDLDDYVRLLIETQFMLNLEKEDTETPKEKPSKNQVQNVPKSIVAPTGKGFRAFEPGVMGVSESQSLLNVRGDGSDQPQPLPSEAKPDPEQPSEPAKSATKGPKFQPIRYKVEDTNYVYRSKELVDLDKKLTTAKEDLRRMMMSEKLLDEGSNKELLKKLNPKHNKIKQFSLGNDHFDTSGFSMDFQVKFIQAQFLNTKLLDLIKEIKDARKRYYLGWVFVTFQTEEMRDNFIAQFEMFKPNPTPPWYLAPVVKLWRTITCSTEVGIEVSRAPNPEDIIWENLGTPAKERGKHIVISYSVTILVLAINFGFTLLFNYLKSKYSDTIGTTLAFGLSALISIFNTVFDQILARTISSFTAYENHETSTQLQKSTLIKIFISQFVNTNLLTLISYVIIFGTKAQAIHQEGGILSDVVSIIISQLLVSPLLLLVNPPFIIGFVKQYLMKMQVHYNLALSVTQQSAHATFQYPEIGVSEMYSDTLKPLMTAFFFMPMMPAGVLAAVGSAFLAQYANLFRLLRTSSTPKPAGPEIAYTSIYLLGFAPLVLALGQLIFEAIFRGQSIGGNSTFAWAFFGVTMFFSFVPIYTFVPSKGCCADLLTPVTNFFDKVGEAFDKASVCFDKISDCIVDGILQCDWSCCKPKDPEAEAQRKIDKEREAQRVKQEKELEQAAGQTLHENEDSNPKKAKNYLNYYNTLKTDYKSENPVTEAEGRQSRQQFEELIKFINEYKSVIISVLSKPLDKLPISELAFDFEATTDLTERVRIIQQKLPKIQEECEKAKYGDLLQNLAKLDFDFLSKVWRNIKKAYNTDPQVDEPVDPNQLEPVSAPQGNLLTGVREAMKQLERAWSPFNPKQVTEKEILIKKSKAIEGYYKAVKEFNEELLKTQTQVKDEPLGAQKAHPRHQEKNKMTGVDLPKKHALWLAFMESRTTPVTKPPQQIKSNVARNQALQDLKKRKKLASKLKFVRVLDLLKSFDQRTLEDTFGSRLAEYHFNQTTLEANTVKAMEDFERSILKKMFIQETPTPEKLD